MLGPKEEERTRGETQCAIAAKIVRSQNKEHEAELTFKSWNATNRTMTSGSAFSSRMRLRNDGNSQLTRHDILARYSIKACLIDAFH